MSRTEATYEVVVVGAGPAGIATAISLSRRGINPVVFEKAPGKRDKYCGGAVSPHAVRLYSQLGLTERYFRDHGFAADEGWICGFGVELYGQTTDGSCGYFIDRRELDWEFQQLAMSQYSVPIRYGAEVVGIELGRDAITLHIREGYATYYCTAKFAVAADGATSLIRTWLSGQKIRKRDMILTSSAIVNADTVPAGRIRFHEDYMPTYSWILPYRGGRVNVGIGMYADIYETRHDRAEVEHMIGQLTDVDYRNRLCRWIINTSAFEKRVYGNRVLLAGDAGGFVDAMTGAGISFALRSGIICARTIALIRKFGPVAVATYWISVLPIVARLAVSKSLQLLLKRIPTLAGYILRWCRSNAAARRALIKYFITA